jgi:hypothetical protein
MKSIRVGVDLAKNVVQLHGADGTDQGYGVDSSSTPAGSRCSRNGSSQVGRPG